MELHRPGTYEWEHAGAQRVLVRLTHRPGTKVDVEVWFGPGIGRSLLLWVNLLHDAVEFADLTGNGYPGALHRIGLGTFAVNCAIQVLQATYEPGTSVRGLLSNPSDAYGLAPDVVARLAEGRRAFWARFGLSASCRGEFERIHGTVGGLAPVLEGQVGGLFPRFVPLSEFKPTTT